MNEHWKKPARLWRRRGADQAPLGPATVTQVDSGSLEAMVRAAIEADEQSPEHHDTLFIDVEAKRMLGWPQIKELHRSPDFPVDI